MIYTLCSDYSDRRKTLKCGIRRFIITLETCIDALALCTRDAYSTGFLGDNHNLCTFLHFII